MSPSRRTVTLTWTKAGAVLATLVAASSLLTWVGSGLVYITDFRGTPQRLAAIEKRQDATAQKLDALTYRIDRQTCVQVEIAAKRDWNRCFLSGAPLGETAGGDVVPAALRHPPVIVEASR